MAELVTGKLGGRPVSVVRGLAERVLPPGEHGPGRRRAHRPREQDMFALGAREAVAGGGPRATRPTASAAPRPPRRSLAALETCGLTAAVAGVSVRVDLPDDQP